MITALRGTRSDRNTTINNRKDNVEHDADENWEPCREVLGEVHRAATPPETGTSSPVPSVASGSTSSRSRMTSSVVASSCGAVVGNNLHTTAVVASGSLGIAGRYKGHSGVGAERLGDGLDLGRVGALGDLSCKQQWAVETWTETRRQQVVGLAGRRLLRIVALI